MKTLSMRVWAAVGALSGLMFCAGCEEENAQAEVPVVTNAVPTTPALAENIEDANSTADKSTNAPSAVPAPRVVQPAETPEDLKVSPALGEIIKLAHAGVGEEVMLAYITNSTQRFNLGSDEIVYLNDLGVSTAVITSLIHHDSSPQTVGQNNVAAPLPPGVALNAPATNVYPNTSEPVTPPLVPEPQAAPYADAGNDQPPADVSSFYSSLAPYGSWVEVAGYGLCWQPTVAVANSYWRPYSDRGRWLWSDYGWYWYSDYSWGWAPFHYGRWCSYPRIGWFWVPDTCWAPAWVSWRYTSYYCGWAPLPPEARYVRGLGLYYRNASVSFGFDFGLSSSHYTFVPLNRFSDRNPYHYYVPTAQAKVVYQNSTVINNIVTGKNNTVINQGIGREKVAKASRGEIPKVAIREAQLMTRKTSRLERLENNGSSLVVVRPKLSADPPTKTASPITRSQPGPKSDSLSAAKTAFEPGRPAKAQSLIAPKQTDVKSGNSFATSRPGTPTLSGDQPVTVSKADPSKPIVLSPDRATDPNKEAPRASGVGQKREIPGNPRSSRFAPPTVAGNIQTDAGRKGNDNPFRSNDRTVAQPNASGVSPGKSPASSAPAGTARIFVPPPVNSRPVTVLPQQQNYSAPGLTKPQPSLSSQDAGGRISRSATSRAEVAPPQFSRPAPAVPPMTPPSARASAPASSAPAPVMRSEPRYSPAPRVESPRPSAPVSAPARSAPTSSAPDTSSRSSGGNKKDGR